MYVYSFLLQKQISVNFSIARSFFSYIIKSELTSDPEWIFSEVKNILIFSLKVCEIWHRIRQGVERAVVPMVSGTLFCASPDMLGCADSVWGRL